MYIRFRFHIHICVKTCMQEKILADLTLAEKLRVQLGEHRLSTELVNNMQDPHVIFLDGPKYTSSSCCYRMHTQKCSLACHGLGWQGTSAGSSQTRSAAQEREESRSMAMSSMSIYIYIYIYRHVRNPWSNIGSQTYPLQNLFLMCLYIYI